MHEFASGDDYLPVCLCLCACADYAMAAREQMAQFAERVPRPSSEDLYDIFSAHGDVCIAFIRDACAQFDVLDGRPSFWMGVEMKSYMAIILENWLAMRALVITSMK